jgi:hypothetical protein
MMSRTHPLKDGVVAMIEIIKADTMSRRNALSLLGKIAALPFLASTALLAASDAEAQTQGMQRRNDRRTGRHERRDDRRTGRTERRQ